MQAFLKKNFIVLLAFALPLLLILGTAIYVYLPVNSVSTSYDFVYTTCERPRETYYECNQYSMDRYTVVDGRLVINEKGGYETHIFLHDTQNNESKEISFAEAQSLVLDKLVTSPDGVSVSYDYDRGPDVLSLFDSGSSHGYYLKKGKSKKELNLINPDAGYYRDNFNFIGWITPGRNE